MTSTVRAPRPAPRRLAPAPVERRPHLRVVEPPTRRQARRRSGGALALAVVVTFGSLFAAAMFHGFLASGQSHLDQVDRDLTETQAELARERLELADLQSPARIAAEAEAKGMVPSEQQTWLSPGTGADPVVTGDPTASAEETDDTTTDATATDDPEDQTGADGSAATSTGVQ